MADQKPSTGHDNAIGWGILACVAAALFWLFWYFFQYEMKSAFRWARWAQIYVVSLFVDDKFSISWHGYPVNLHQMRDYIPTMGYADLTSQNLGIISAVAMVPLSWFFTIVIGVMGFWAAMTGPGTQFRRKLDLNALIRAQSETFPFIAPFIKFNPSNQPPRPPGAPVPAKLPAFAEALGPEEWLAYNQVPIADGQSVDADAAYAAFTKQLGPRWAGAQKLAPYKQILLAAFCLKTVRKRKDADVMLGRLAKCWSFERGLQLGKDGKLLREARRILRDKKLAGLTLSRCNQHAFETTALLQGLLTARSEGGVLAPAQFVWLRAHDRALWYPLNNLGRQAFHMEALGAMAHFKAERLMKRPVPRPKLDFAVQSIREYMTSLKARPIPQIDRAGLKKAGNRQQKRK